MKYLFIIFAVLISIVCCRKKEAIKETFDKNLNKVNSKLHLKDSFQIAEKFNQIDTITDKSLVEKLKPIKENFKRINSIKKTDWSSVKTKDLEGTNEGGEATYYYFNNILDKIITKEYGESFQILTEYYLLNGKLSFVYQKRLKYNRPIYKNEADESDKEIFNFEKSQIEEYRNYFENEKLILQIKDQKTESETSTEHIKKEQAEIIENFNRLINLEKEKN